MVDNSRIPWALAVCLLPYVSSSPREISALGIFPPRAAPQLFHMVCAHWWWNTFLSGWWKEGRWKLELQAREAAASLWAQTVVLGQCWLVWCSVCLAMVQTAEEFWLQPGVRMAPANFSKSSLTWDWGNFKVKRWIFSIWMRRPYFAYVYSMKGSERNAL